MDEPEKRPNVEAEPRVSDRKRGCREHREDLLDAAIEESFPASDPPSIARPADCEPDERDQD